MKYEIEDFELTGISLNPQICKYFITNMRIFVNHFLQIGLL